MPTSYLDDGTDPYWERGPAVGVILGAPFRPYIDFAVQPETSWHVGPDKAAVYDPEDLEVDAVLVCAP